MRLTRLGSSLLAGVLVCAAACGTRNPGAGIGGGGSEDPEGPVGKPSPFRAVETFVSPLEVIAGTEIGVHCIVSEGREYLPGVPTAIAVEPHGGSISGSDSRFQFTPISAGIYNVTCRTADNSVVDPNGISVEVLEAGPAVVETVLTLTSSEAGLPVPVDCDVWDAFGNPLDRHAHGAVTTLDLDAGLTLDPPSGESHTVRGTVIGDYDVACRIDEIVDDTPETLTITPGIPGGTETRVDSTTVAPTEDITVGCTVTDRFGNAVDAAETSVQVIADDASTPDENGLVQDDKTFSATRAGTYFVFCSVPGYMAADETPAVIEVEPGLPHHWIVELPAQDCFWEDRGLPLLYLVYDYWGNEVDLSYPPGDLAVTSTPGGASVDAKGVVRVLGEGDFEISIGIATAIDTSHECESGAGILCANDAFTVSVRIDSTPPAINIGSPARAARLSQGGTGNSTVAIGGNATDAVSTIEALEINGTSFAVSGAGQYEPISTTQSSRWGVNIITGSAVDSCGNRRVIAQSYMRSGAYFPAATWPSSGSRASTGILARLNQVVIDDGDPDLDDLRSIGQRVVDSIDFNSLIAPGQAFGSDPLRSSCSFCKWWTDTSYWAGRHPSSSRQITGDVTINSLTAVGGGLSFAMSLSDLALPLRARACARECACGIRATQCTGNIDFWVNGSGTANGTLSISLAGSNPVVSVSAISVNVSNLAVNNLNFSCGALDFLCNPLEDIVEAIINGALSAFEGDVEDFLEDIVRDEISDLVEAFLRDFALDTGFSLPAPLDMTINISSGLDYIDFDGPPGSGNGELGLGAQLYPDARGTGTSPNGDTIPASAGAIRKNGSRSGFSSSAYAFGLGLKDDLINQILWSLWYGGGLDLNLDDLGDLIGGSFDLSGIEMTLFAASPPVVMPGQSGEQLDIGLGDAYVHAVVDLVELLGSEASGAPPLEVGLYLSAIVPGYIDLDVEPSSGDPTLFICLAESTDTVHCPTNMPDAEIYVEVVQIDDEGYQGIMTDLFTNLLRLLVPRLLESAIGNFPIPEFDLGGLAGLPAGTVLKLGNPGLGLTRPSIYYYRATGSLVP